MRSPFPGMNPYLENPELWSEVHSRLIVAIADDLNNSLSEKYRIAIEKRTYFSTEEDSVLVGIPDVTIVSHQPKAPQSETIATLAPPTEPITVTVPMSKEVQERYLEIREVSTGAVITAIEILSPKNKRPGEGRQAYERKRHQILGSLTHLVEIDWLRGGQPLPIGGTIPSDYRMLVSRSDCRPAAQLYAFNLRQEIPALAVPVANGDTEPVLDLQSLLHNVYERGRYHLAIDYSQLPTTALSPESQAWLIDLLCNQGLRSSLSA